MHYVTFALLFVTWAGLAYLFLIKKKVIFLATVKSLSHQIKCEINKPQAEGSASGLHLTPNFSQHWIGELSVNKWENKVTRITYLVFFML